MNLDDLPAAFFNLEVRPTARSKGHDALAQCGDGAHGFLTDQLWMEGAIPNCTYSRNQNP